MLERWKKLNEELEKVLNEISYETKKSYLAKRQAQLDNAKRAMEKAQRLVRDTEANKQGKRKLTDEQLNQLLDNIKQEFPKWGDRYFYKEGEVLEAGNIDEDDNSCLIGIEYNNKYLYIRILWTERASDNKISETFSLDDFNFSKLNNKVLSFVRNFMKTHEKEQATNNKLYSKLDKALETLKKLLSKIKTDQLDPENDKFNKKVADKLTYSSAREMYPAVKSIGTTVILQSTDGYKDDYQIKAVGLTKKLTVGIFYWTQRWSRIDYTSLENAKATIEDKTKAANKLIDILKSQTSGRSNLKSQEKQLKANKELASRVIEEVKDELRKIDRGGDWGSIKEESWGYTFSVRDWGEWGSAGDWEEDNDFMRLRADWYDKKYEIQEKLQKKYPDLKISISCGEKRYLDCSVTW